MLLSDGKDGVQNDGADIERGHGQVGALSAPSNAQESGRHWCQRDHRSGRDSIFYSVDTLRGNVEKCVQMLAESVMCPSLLDNEIEEASVGVASRRDT